MVLQEGAQLSCRPTVAECHKTLPFKMETDSGINNDPSPPPPSITCADAFVFDAALCVQPLTHLQTAHEPQRSHYQTRRAGVGAPGLLSISTGWRRIWLSLFSLRSMRGICIPSRLFWDNGYYSGWRNAPQCKAIQIDRTQVNNKNIPLTPALQTQLQDIERLHRHSHLLQLNPDSFSL